MTKELVIVQSGGEALCGLLFLPPGKPHPPAVIVCHGAFEFKENHLALCEALAGSGIAALALDMSGHGASQGEPWRVDIAHWVADIRAAVDFLAQRPGLDATRIGAFGFSSGGTAVLEAALAEPRLKALVTLSATVRDMEGAEAVAFRLLVALGRVSLALRRKELRISFAAALRWQHFAFDVDANRGIIEDPRVREAYASVPFPGSAGCYFVDTIERVAAIGAPCLVLHGAEDRIDPPETARLLHGRLACEKGLAILPRCGHFGHLDGERLRVISLTTDWMGSHLG